MRLYLDTLGIFPYEHAREILDHTGRLAVISKDSYYPNTFKDLPLSTKLVGLFSNSNNSLENAHRDPMREDHVFVYIFYQKYDTSLRNPLRRYFKGVREIHLKNYTKKELFEIIGQRIDHCLRFKSPQFKICSKATYDLMIDHLNLRSYPLFTEYEQLIEVQKNYSEPIFNIPTNKGHVPNVIRCSNVEELIQFLITTYTNDPKTVYRK